MNNTYTARQLLILAVYIVYLNFLGYNRSLIRASLTERDRLVFAIYRYNVFYKECCDQCQFTAWINSVILVLDLFAIYTPTSENILLYLDRHGIYSYH